MNLPMSDYTIAQVRKDEWPALAGQFLDYSYQQSWPYAHALSDRRGACCEYVAIRCGGELLGVASVRVRTIPVVGSGIAYISGGPLTRFGRSDDVERLLACFAALEEEYVQRRGLVMRVLPPVGTPQWNVEVKEALLETQWQIVDQPRTYRTILLDISRPLEEIRASCSKYWRRNLRRAERRTLEIRSAAGGSLFPELTALYERLTARKTFSISLGASFYAQLQSHLSGEEQFVVSIIDLEGEPVAGLAVSMLGDTAAPVVLATDEHGLRNYAAYRLQWHSIEMAIARGMRCYDLGGIDPAANAGVHNFKQGLRGEDITAPGPYEATRSVARRLIVRGLENLYQKVA